MDPTNNPALVPDATVAVERVSKWFGQKVAVSDVTCSFGPGMTGLLGPNGAGKTTLLRLIVGLLTPSEGATRILGDNARAAPEVYRHVGVVPEEDAVYTGMTARQYVEYAARLNGLEDVPGAASKAIDLVELSGDADRSIGGFSKGMRQRTKVAAGMVHEPRILILDEPLNGTDPVQRARLIAIFRRLGDAGHTVIVSSHVLQEVERMTDRVIAMVDGKLAAAGDISAIRRAMTDIPYRVRIDTDDARHLAASLTTEGLIDGVQVADKLLHVETGDLTLLGRRLPSLSRELGVRVTGFRPEDESLESVFRYLVRR